MSAQHPFLTDEEILQIVEPLTQPAAIMRWFRNNGFPDIKARPNGMPLISRAYFDAVTLAGAAKQVQENATATGTQPNVQAYLDRFGKNAKIKLIR